MSRTGLADRIAYCEKELAALRALDTGCKGCDHYVDGKCIVAGGMEIPADVIGVGCPSWEYDDVPF